MSQIVLKGKTLLSDLRCLVEINGECYEKGCDKIKFEHQIENRGNYIWLKAKATNRSNETFQLGGFHFKQTGIHPDALAIDGKNLRLYKEGWTMASPAASIRYNECDFDCNPEYVRFAHSNAAEHEEAKPNKICAEHTVVVNDAQSGRSVLAGFISSADQLGQFIVELSAAGVSRFEAVSNCDNIDFAPGDTVESEELVILSGGDAYTLLEEFAALWGERMHALSWSHTPTGWCSWYYYFDKITEKDMLENIEFLRNHKDRFPVEYIQLDDGYQHALGDWLRCNEKFPHGLQFLAAEVKKSGFKPGLWVAPFMVEERSDLYQNHPDWMVKNAKGETVWALQWRDNSRTAVLDGTHPEAQKFLTELFTTIASYGFEYVKLDFMVQACTMDDGRYFDRKATRAQALRRGLAAIRKGMKDRFILGCTVPLGPVVGLVNGERIGTDITPYWQGEGQQFRESPTVPNVCRNIVNRCYMHKKLWISDPDTHIARIDNNKLTAGEVELWTYAIYLTGGMMLLSDRFASLTPERAKYSQLLLQKTDVFKTRPLDFMEHEYPAVWYAVNRETGDKVIGVFNFEEKSRQIEVDLNKVGGQAFAVKNFITGEDCGVKQGKFAIEVPAHSCKVISLK